MSLTGSLATMSLADVLRWVDQRAKTGTLLVESPEHSTTLTLRDGRIISSASTDPRFYLGQLLLALTRVTEEDLRRAFDRQERTRVYLGRNMYVKTLLGKILLEDGLLSEPEITRVLRIKTEETVFNLFLIEEGTFRFNDGELPPEELVPISLPIDRVVARGLERRQRWQRIRERVPSNAATFRVRGDRLPEPPELDDLTARLAPLLAQGLTILDCMLRLHATEYAVNRAAFHMIEAGWLELAGEATPAAPPLAASAGPGAPADELVERGLQYFDQRAYEDTLVVARQALAGDPSHPGARRLLERSERELTDSFYARVCPPLGVPRLVGELKPAELADRSPEERFLLERVNGTWSVGDLIKLSPLKEVDALVILKRLLAQGRIAIDLGSGPVQ